MKRSWCLLVAVGVATLLTNVSARPVAAAEARFVMVSAGGGHSCGITTAATVRCWGWDAFGQLGDALTPDYGSHPYPIAVRGLRGHVAILSAGAYHTCALVHAPSGGDRVECWGLGYGATPVMVAGLGSDVRALASGGLHTCALLASGAVKCWGDNGAGQLGDGQNCGAACTTPVDVVGLGSGITSIAAGFAHTCALVVEEPAGPEGSLKCWGWNTSAQLGAETVQLCTLLGSPGECSTTPVTVADLADGVTGVTAGFAHTCALVTGGAVKCWGYNNAGQVGDGGTCANPCRTPSDVCAGGPEPCSATLPGAREVSAGFLSACALVEAGGVKCWGDNATGELGNGGGGHEDDVSANPVDVCALGRQDCTSALTGATHISSGGSAPGGLLSSGHTCAVIDDGRVGCWGDNAFGQAGTAGDTQCAVGDASAPCNPVPRGISTLSGDADCDGNVDSIDATLILQIAARLLPMPACPEGDTNSNGEIDAVDAALVLQRSAGYL